MMIKSKFITICFLCIQNFIFGQITLTKSDDFKRLSFEMQQALQFAMNNNANKGIEIFDKVINDATSKNYTEILPVIIVAQSRLLAITNDYQLGLEKLLKAEPYIEKDSMTSIAGDFYEYKALCYIKLMQYQEALTALKKSEAIRRKVEHAKNWRTYNGMARVYHKLNQHDEAEKYSQEAEKLSKIQNSRRVLLDLQNELKFDEKDGTINALAMEKDTAISKLNRSNQQNKLLLIGLGLFSLISSLLYIILRQRNRLNNEMKSKNEVISKSLEEKEYLIKEIHHRVKNNLQVISSLLSLQSRTVEDQNAINALNESQSRVMSMSLIHQNLYKDGHLSQLNVKSYLNNLTKQLFEVYNIKNDHIQLKTEVDDIIMDVASLVPLGLIVNELITNALKYAFIDRENGVIDLSLKYDKDEIVLKVSDDGIGKSPIQNKEGFGTRLIHTFAKRLNGELSYNIHNGTNVEIRMTDLQFSVL